MKLSCVSEAASISAPHSSRKLRRSSIRILSLSNPLLKHGRRFRPFVAFAKVEPVRILAGDLRPDEDGPDSLGSRPRLGGVHQPRADAEASRIAGDDEPADLDVSARLYMVADAQVHPREDSAILLGDEKRVASEPARESHALEDYFRGSGVAELPAQF